MTQNSTTPNMNWHAFAEEALDLWQTQLAATASDPKAKEEMARLVTPFNQMFAEWSATMQQAQRNAQNATPDASAGPVPEPGSPADTGSGDAVTAASGSNEAGPTLSEFGSRSDTEAVVITESQEPPPADPCTSITTCQPDQAQAASFSSPPSSDGDGALVQLASRLAHLEQKLDELLTRTSELEKSDQRAKRNALLAARAQAVRAAADGK